MISSIKITSLNNIGSNLSYTSLFPVVDMSGTPTTKNANLQIVGNLILSGAGGSYFPPAGQAILAQSVTNAAQPNITSVGTLANLSVVDVSTVRIPGGNNGYVLQTNGNGNLSWTAQSGSGNGNPGGANSQIQFNDSGLFGGSPSLTWDSPNTQLNTVNFAAEQATIYGPLATVDATVTGNLNLDANINGTRGFITINPDPGNSGLAWQFGDEGPNVSLLIAPQSDDANIGGISLPGYSGEAFLGWLGNTANLLPSPFINTLLIDSSNSVTISTQLGMGFGSAGWVFDHAGNLTLPGNGEVAINYANGVPYGGGGNTGNVTFNDINIIGTGNLHLQPNPNNAGAFLDIYLTIGPDIHIAGNGENLILGRDNNANVSVNANGSVSIQSTDFVSVAPTTIVISGADFATVNTTYIRDLNQLTPSWYPAGYNPATDPYILFDTEWGIWTPGFGQALYVNIGTLTNPLTQWNTNPPLGSVPPTGTYFPTINTNLWTFGTDGNLTAPGNADFNGNVVTIGSGASELAASLQNATLVISDNGSAYVQAAITNVADIGSADWVAYGHHGNDAGGWVDVGFTSSFFSDANYTITGSGDGYLFAEAYLPDQAPAIGGGNLVLATGSQGTTKDIIFGTGGFLTENIFGRISDSNNELELSRTGSSLNFVGGGNIIGANNIQAGNLTVNNINLSGHIFGTSNPSLEGSATGQMSSGNLTTVSYTAGAQSVIVVASACETGNSGGNAVASITGITGLGLTWIQRSSYVDPTTLCGQKSEIWYAINNSATPVSGVITISFDINVDDQSTIVSSYQNVNLNNPWTSSGPQYSNQVNPTSNVATITANIAEHNTTGVVFMSTPNFGNSENGAGYADGWNTVNQVLNSGADLWEYSYFSCLPFLNPQSDLVVNSTNAVLPNDADGNATGLTIIFDALLGGTGLSVDRLSNGAYSAILTSSGNLNLPGNLAVSGGVITGGIPTQIDINDSITGISIGPNCNVTLSGNTFNYAERGTVVIGNVNSTTQAIGTWYYEASWFNAFNIFTDNTYSTPVDSSTWTTFVGPTDGTATITGYSPIVPITIDAGGYQTVFGIDGNIYLPSNELGNTASISTPFNANLSFKVGGTNTYTLGYDGNLTLPGNTFAVNYANGTQVNIGGGGGATNLIANGNSYANIATADGNLVVNVGTDGYGTWIFETGTGNLIGPGNVSQGAGIVFSAEQSVYIREDMGQLNIDAFGTVITSNSGNTGNTQSWNFDNDGNLTVPGNIIGNNLGNPMYITGATANTDRIAGTLVLSGGSTTNGIGGLPSAGGALVLNGGTATGCATVGGSVLINAGQGDGDWGNITLTVNSKATLFNESGQVILPAVKIGTEITYDPGNPYEGEQLGLYGTRRIISPNSGNTNQVTISTIIQSPQFGSPQVVYTAYNAKVWAFRMTMRIQHGAGTPQNMQMADIFAARNDSGDITYSITNRLKTDPTEDDVVIVPAYDPIYGTMFINATATGNGTAANGSYYFTFDVVEFNQTFD